jgi:sulfite reductase beta subunit-like hemoprotein
LEFIRLRDSREEKSMSGDLEINAWDQKQPKSVPDDATSGIIPVLQDEIDTLVEEVRGFRAGEREGVEFTAFRLRQGVYGQRQEDLQMLRVKIPGGILTSAQLRALGEVARLYAPLKKGHITTRENVQFHHLKLETATEAIRLLAEVGLTSREACGNTVRNVISCPFAGVCQRELFDVVPYMAAYVRYFIRKPFVQNMPRKFKTSFSPCASDCAVAPFHDLGFVAQVREENGQRRLGFRIHAGGGSSIMPRAAQAVYDFVPVEDYLRVAEAILRSYNKMDELRKNRMMARLKVYIDRHGLEAFRQIVEKELQEDWAQKPIDPTPYMVNRYEPVRPPYSNGNRNGDTPSVDFAAWQSSNVVPQRQRGYFAIQVKVPMGDLRPDQFFALADLSERFGNSQARTTWEQNIVFRWVGEDHLPQLWDELKKIGLGEVGAEEITDVTSCPGTDSCKLGITASMGLGRAIRELLLEMQIDDPLVRAMHIKISGCPNGCGRHHLANIGFQGASVKSTDGRQVPAYEMYVGGKFEGGEFRFASRIAEKIPSKRVPEAVRRILGYYQAERQPGEPFNAFVDRIGPKALGPLVSDLKAMGGLNESNFDTFVDFERDTLFEVVRGEGECAAP